MFAMHSLLKDAMCTLTRGYEKIKASRRPMSLLSQPWKSGRLVSGARFFPVKNLMTSSSCSIDGALQEIGNATNRAGDGAILKLLWGPEIQNLFLECFRSVSRFAAEFVPETPSRTRHLQFVILLLPRSRRPSVASPDYSGWFST